MHCKNCGWNNPDNAKECEKCHSRFKNVLNPKRPNPFRPGDKRDLGETPTVMGSIGGSALPKSLYDRPKEKGQNMNDSLSKGTFVSEIFHTDSNAPQNCPECGYPLGGGTTSCPNCGHAVPSGAPSPAEPPAKKLTRIGTVLSSGSPLFGEQSGPHLTPVDENENVISDAIPVKGDSALFGGNTFAIDNSTETIRLSNDDGNWCIEALDDNIPVFIRVAGGKFSLVDGDTVLINGKKFIFHK